MLTNQSLRVAFVTTITIISRLRAERALSNPATPAPTPSPYHPHLHHSLHPDAILDSLATLGGDEGIASCSVPGHYVCLFFFISISIDNSQIEFKWTMGFLSIKS